MEPSGRQGKPTQQTSPSPLVRRPGAPPVPQRLRAEPARFGGTARYPDGVAVEVVRTSREEVTERGAGARTGAAYALLTVRVVNGSPATQEIGQAVVSLTGAQTLEPVTTAETAELPASLPAGQAAVARYGFLLPTRGGGDAVFALDLQAQRLPAVFTGPLP